MMSHDFLLPRKPVEFMFTVFVAVFFLYALVMASDQKSKQPQMMQQTQGPQLMQTEAGVRHIGRYTVAGWNPYMRENDDGTWTVGIPNTDTMGGYHQHSFATEVEAKTFFEANKSTN